MNAPDPTLSDAAFRASHVGASEVAALFDASPWVTKFELWHRKQGNIDTPEFNRVDEDGKPENERIEWGVRLEPVILQAACDRYGYKPLETPHRISNGKGLGGHPDMRALCPRRGPGILEVKCADWLVAKKWGDEPPLHYLLQSLAYQGLTESNWGDVIVLVGGNELRRYQYEFRPVIYADIEARVIEFWRSVEEGTAPKPDYTRDGDVIREIYDAPTDTIIDLARDNRAYELCADWVAAKAEMKAAETRVEAAKAELLDKLGNNATGTLDGYRISATPVAASPGTLITEEHVGTYVGARKGFRRFAVKEIA